MQAWVFLLTGSSSLWRELVILCAVALVLALRWKGMKQRGFFVCTALLCGLLLGRLRDGLMGGKSAGWRKLDAEGGVSYDFVSKLTTDYYWAIGLLVMLVVMPWLVSFLKPFRTPRVE